MSPPVSPPRVFSRSLPIMDRYTIDHAIEITINACLRNYADSPLHMLESWTILILNASEHKHDVQKLLDAIHTIQDLLLLSPYNDHRQFDETDPLRLRFGIINTLNFMIYDIEKLVDRITAVKPGLNDQCTELHCQFNRVREMHLLKKKNVVVVVDDDDNVAVRKNKRIKRRSG